MTVLEALRYIYENYEPVAFRYNCKPGMCGLCGVTPNGKRVLACEVYVEPRESTIEPLRRFPIIRGLVVNIVIYAEDEKGNIILKRGEATSRRV